MQGIIVAAGVGSRLRPYTDNKPKCLLEINQKPIIYYIVEAMIQNNIRDIVIVVGYCKNQIIDYLTQKFKDAQFTFIENQDYESTNNAYSLLLARPYIKDSFLLSDADIMFEAHILNDLIKSPSKPVLAIKMNEWNKESIKTCLNSDKVIAEISKEVENNSHYYGESVGLEVFSLDQGLKLFEMLEKRIIKENRLTEFYEASFQELIQQGMSFYPLDIKDALAMEIDNEEDYLEAQKFFS